MLIPYSTDAPLYHWPITTVALIVINVAVYLPMISLSGADYAHAVAPWILSYGDGLHLVQWITSNFIHAGLMHLLGNMFVLWGFGLVVEGKLGWWRFLLVYLAIGFVECGIEQTITLKMETGGSLGASAVIYGVMAIALVWAPQNEMSCLFIWRRVSDFQIAISSLAGGCLALQVFTGIFGGLSISSQFLHLLGAALGFGVGVVLLKSGWVDCENWDLFSVWAGRHTQTLVEQREDAQREIARLIERERGGGQAIAKPVARPAALPSATRPAAPVPARTAATLEDVRRLVATGQPELAYRTHVAMAGRSPTWSLPEEDLVQIITALQQQGQWAASVPPMVEYVRRPGSRAPQVRLQLAHVLIEQEHRPAQALVVLAKLASTSLSVPERNLLASLRQRAVVLREQNPLEQPTEDW